MGKLGWLGNSFTAVPALDLVTMDCELSPYPGPFRATNCLLKVKWLKQDILNPDYEAKVIQSECSTAKHSDPW